MRSIGQGVWSVFGKVASIVGNLLPMPPSSDAPPPDVDGRRPQDTDVARMKVGLEEKKGKGGFR